MYFREKRTPSGKVLQLTQSFRNQDDKPRQRVIVSLGDAAIDAADRSAIAKKIDLLLSGQKELIPYPLNESQQGWVDHILRLIEKKGIRSLNDLTSTPENTPLQNVQLDKIEHTDSSSAGAELLGLHAWERLKLSETLQSLGFNPSQIRCAQASVVNRLVEPVSEHALPAWLENCSALPDLLQESFHGKHVEGRFYRISDALHENASALEAHLRQRQESLFGARPSIFIYDLTNTYFEGKCLKNPDARYGKSKEKRSDCPLVSIAIAYSAEGLPLSHKVFAGNQNDGASFPEMLDILEEQWEEMRLLGDQRPMFIMDSGIGIEKNLRLLRQKGFDYLVNDKRSHRNQHEEVFSDRKLFEKIPGKSVFVRKETVTIEEEDPEDKKSTLSWEESRLFCYSEARGEKEKAMREKARSRFVADLQKLAEQVRTGKLKQEDKVHKKVGRLCERHKSVSRFYTISTDLSEPKGKSKKREVTKVEWKEREDLGEQEDLYGCYLMRSNRTFGEAPQMWETYMNLTNAEDGFRSLKTDLGVRPVRHQTQARVQAHIFISILALHLLCFLKKSLAEHGEYRSWTTIKRLMRSHSYATLIVPTDSATHHIRKLGRPDQTQQDIYRKLGIDWKQSPAQSVTLPLKKL